MCKECNRLNDVDFVHCVFCGCTLHTYEPIQNAPIVQDEAQKKAPIYKATVQKQVPVSSAKEEKNSPIIKQTQEVATKKAKKQLIEKEFEGIEVLADETPRKNDQQRKRKFSYNEKANKNLL